MAEEHTRKIRIYIGEQDVILNFFKEKGAEETTDRDISLSMGNTGIKIIYLTEFPSIVFNKPPDKTLFNIADTLLERFDHAYILIPHNPIPFDGTPLTKVLYGAKASIEARGCRMEFLSNLESIAHQALKYMEKHNDGKQRGRLKHTEINDIRFLMLYDEIGPVLAKRLIKHFQTKEKVVNATPPQLEKVRGIGQQKAFKIFNTLQEGGESWE